MVRTLSLFDGISCGQLALHRAGIVPQYYLASEIDQSAITVTQHHFPNTVQLGDVSHVRMLAERGLLDDIELLIGGSPCQGFSNAGAGLNFNDPRSSLFFEYVRIKNAVKPLWFLLENVKMKKEWQNVISDYLGVRPILINSGMFTGQNRERLYWTNIPVAPIFDSGVTLIDQLEPGWVSDRRWSYCIDANYGKGSNFKRYFHRSSRQIVFRDGKIPIKPNVEWANTLQRTMSNDWRKLSRVEAERLQGIPENYTSMLGDFDSYHAIGNGWTVDVIAHIFRGML